MSESLLSKEELAELWKNRESKALLEELRKLNGNMEALRNLLQNCTLSASHDDHNSINVRIV